MCKSFPLLLNGFFTGGFALLFFLLAGVPSSWAENALAELSPSEINRLGERMYRDGILPSGAAMTAYIHDDLEVDSTAFSCSSCHLRAGLGSVEGGVVTPPTTGKKLYAPYRRPPSLDDIPDRAGRNIYAKTVTMRPAYTRESLAAALRFGIDPAGQTFNDVMPRYSLADPEMSILISYLEGLSAEPSPGASSSELVFATIITDDVSIADRQALLLPLQDYISKKNQQQGIYNDFKKFGYVPSSDMKYAFRKITLDLWELKGPPESWNRQLAAYYQQRPVFAVLGGISNRDWRPIHDFCEEQQLPCLFPITNLPALTTSDWYTFYFNKGYAQEGEAVARYLHRLESLVAKTPILQIVQDSPVGSTLAAGFQQSWSEMGRPAVTTLTLTPSQLLDPAALRNILKKHKPEVLLLWTDAEILPELSKFVDLLAPRGMVFVSSGYLGGKTVDITENIRNRVYISYPYRLTPYVGSKTGGIDAKVPILPSAKDIGDQRITSRTINTLQQATLQGLNLLYDNLYRDYLLDVMSMQKDLIVRDYERLSFGPGQRYASKGCYIVQLGPGVDPPLLPRSEWVIH